MFNVIIIGGENIPSYDVFQRECIKFLRGKAESGERIRILSTGDEYVTKFCYMFGIETKTIYCDWKRNGRAALAVRNKAIVAEANAIIYFDSNKKDLDMLYDYALNHGLANSQRRVLISNLITP